MDKQLLAALDLPETATLADAIAKINELKSSKQAAEGDMKKAQAACRKASCDAFIVAHKAQIADEAKFREAYEKNPEATEAAFGVFKASPEKQPSQTRIVARDAKTPKQSASEDSGASDAQRRTAQHSAIAVCRAANPGMTCREAEAVCRRNDPALFAAEDTAAE